MEAENQERTIMEFEGIDSWNRPIFKVPGTKMRFGSTEILFNQSAGKTEVLEGLQLSDLCYFGNSFDCEPIAGFNLGESNIIHMKSGRVLKLFLK